MSNPRPYGRPWRRLKQQVLDSNRVCALQLEGCTRYATCVDHIVPLALGGHPTDRANLAGVCQHCNNVKGTRTDLQPTPVRSRDW